ncbi:hypothetical protein Trydic_g5073, partial [Trypoxylus dichotomus]
MVHSFIVEDPTSNGQLVCSVHLTQ